MCIFHRFFAFRQVIGSGVLGWMLFAGGLAEAGLTWDQKQVVLQTEPGVDKVEALFAFKNTGDEPITFSSLEPDCGCTTAAMTQKTFASGETGEIELVFEVGDRRGPQIKRVLVVTDDPEQPRSTLELRVSIRERVRVRPRLLLWAKDEPREPKEVLVTVLGRYPLEVALVESEPLDKSTSVAPVDGEIASKIEVQAQLVGPMSVLVEPLDAGRTYRVLVAPPDDDLQHRTVIELVTNADEQVRLRPLRILARTEGTPQPEEGGEDDETEAVTSAGDGAP